MKLKAYAKINLALDVTGKLPNGYHQLDMLMQTISLYDILEISRTAGGISLDCSGYTGDPQKNTAVIAAQAFFEFSGINGGAKIKITKNIPSEAGLGGGSSDGAAVISALNLIYNTCYPADVLQKIALRVGADAPFFIKGGLMRATGIGENLSPLKNGCNFHYLLAKPSGGVSTAQAYSLSDANTLKAIDINTAAAALEAGNQTEYFNTAQNALYDAAKQLCPQIPILIEKLYALGARFAMMTGSGSCVFSVFDDNNKKNQAECILRREYDFVATAVNSPKGCELSADAATGHLL